MKNIKNKILAGLIIGALCITSMPTLAAETISVQVNGKKVDFPGQRPQVISGTTYVPLRGVFEELGYKVKWEASNKTIILTNEDTNITLKQDSSYTLNNEQKALNNKILVIQGSTMLPLREVSTLVGAKADWDSKTKTVIISYEASENLQEGTSEGKTSGTSGGVVITSSAINDPLLLEYLNIMKKREQKLTGLRIDYEVNDPVLQLAASDIPNYLKDFKAVNDSDIEALKAIEADGAFEELREKAITVINKNNEVMEKVLIDKVEFQEAMKIAYEVKYKEAMRTYCEKKGIDPEILFGNENFAYSLIWVY